MDGRQMTVRPRAMALTMLAVGGLALFSCSGPVVTAVGDSSDLVIVVDDGASELSELVEGVMGETVTWLVKEPCFRTTVTTPEQLGDLRNMRHVLLVGSWDGGSVSDLATRVFPRLDRHEPVTLRIAEDIWAKGQVVGVVMGRDAEEVGDYFRRAPDDVRQELVSAAVNRLAASLRKASEEAGAAGALANRFGWSICPPTGYDFFTTDAADGFVFFRRTRPDRTVTVYWEDGEPGYVSEQYVIAKREELSERYFDGDEIEYRRPLVTERVDFLGRPAVRVSGWWGNRELVGGGPFRTYCFFDESSGRVYFIDLGLFAPGLDKTALMRNLDAIAHTFRTTS